MIRKMLNLNHKNLTTREKSLELIKEIYYFYGKLPDRERYIIIPPIKRGTHQILRKDMS